MQKKIKVAEIITRLDWGGSPDIIRSICESADSANFDVKLITGPSKNLSAKTKKFLEKFVDKTFVIGSLNRDINPVNDFRTLIKLYSLFRKEKFDIVHTHTAKAGILGRCAAWLAGTPVIIHTSHGHNFYGYFGSVGSRMVVIIEKIAGIFTDKIIALTELEKKDLIAYGVGNSGKIIVFNSGIDLEEFEKNETDILEKKEEFNIKPDEKVVGMINRLEPIKGPEYFIEAAKLVSGKIPKVKFLIVGEGSLREKLEAKCRELRIDSKTIFTGWREDVPKILPVLDLLVLPSMNEAVGIVLIEAGACGVPVIATHVGGIPEIIKYNETGILVSPGSSKDLAEAIITLLGDDIRRQKMSESAVEWVNKKFDINNLVEKIYDLYENEIR